MTGAPDAPLTHRTLGDFTVGAKLGEGGHGVVYRAEQRGLGREAVIKVLRARHGASDGASDRVQRFLREARLASRLDHPFAAHIYAFGAEPDGLLWIAMELVRGTTLRNVLDAQPGGRLPVPRMVALLDGLCEVVHTAHEQGIVHRDLKPDNVMVLSRAGRLLPKLLDLGIAKLVTEAIGDPDAGGEPGPERDASPSGEVSADGATVTQAGALIGSPLYMAPEQWRGDEVDARTDQYALGVVAFEMLAGRRPFTGPTMAAIARAHLEAEVPALPDDVPAALSAVIARAVAKRPAERFPSALAFAAAVRAAAGLRFAAEALPRLPDELRAELAWLPQPIADAIAELEAARNPHQARDALWKIVRVLARWLGVLALCARNRTRSPADDAPGVAAALRELHRRELGDEDWFDLVRALTRPFAAIRDAHPIPELVEFALAEPSPLAPLLALRAGDAAATSEESLRDRLARTLPVLAPVLRAIGFLGSYQLIVPCRGERGGWAEVWMGTRRPARPAIAVPPGLAAGEPLLADLDGRPVLQLAPLVQLAAPAPGAHDELFVFAGPGRIRERGARLIAEPQGFERHDDQVWSWFRAGLVAGDDADPATTEATPYRGLAAFTEADAGAFFGRERAAVGFVNQLREQPLLAVVGPSGTGKSSFLRAGVIPALPAGWRAVVIRPGATPLAALASRVEPARAAAAASGETLVIIVDQLEELFTLGAEPGERDRFAAELARLADADPPTRVVLALRDDFLARTGELAALRDRLARAVTLLATPADDDLVRVLVEPARRAGYELDPGLAQRMVATVAGRPGALALLSFTALRLWELRDRHFRRLTAAAYDAIGGVEGALARHAEAVLQACTSEEQRLVRTAFRQLVTAEGTRAVVSRRELHDVLGTSTAARAIVDRLIDARLVVVAEGDAGDQRIEIIHEALLAAWPRLVEWRRDDAEGARLRDQLRAAARHWHDRGRPRGLLWRDEALDDYLRWRARWPAALPALDRAFGDTSVRDAARGRRIRRTLAAAAAAVVVAGVVGLALLYRASQRSAAVARTALNDSLVQQGQQALFGGDYLAALPLLARAYRGGDRSLALRTLLHRAIKLADQPRIRLHREIAAAAFRPDGRTVIAIGYDGELAIADAATGRITARIAATPGAIARSDPARTDAGGSAVGTGGDHAVPAAISGDGSLAAVARDGAVLLWDGTAARTLPADRPLDPATTKLALDVTGDQLAVASPGELVAWRVRDGARLWSVAIDRPVGLPSWVGDRVAVNTERAAVLAGPDGARPLGRIRKLAALGPDRLAVVEARRVVVRDTTGDTDHAFELPDVTAVAVTRDGRRVALGVRAGFVEIDDVASGRRLGLLTGHTSEVVAAVFTTDGKRLATMATDHSVRIWDTESSRELVHHVGIDSSPHELRLSPDESRVLAVCAGDAWLYPLDDPSTDLVIDAGEPAGAAQFVAGGSQIAVTLDSGVALWDARSGRRLAKLDAHVFDGAHLSPDRRLVAIPINETHDAELRELPGGALRARLTSTDQITSAVFHPAGQRVATANAGGLIEIWALDGTRLDVLRGHESVVQDVAFSPDGQRLLSASNDRTARIWDLAGPRELVRVHHGDEIDAARFDRTGARFVTAGNDRTLALWDSVTGTALWSFRHDAGLRSAAIGDGGLIAGATTSGVIQLWDTTTGKEAGRFRHGARMMAVDFAGDRLLATSIDGRIVVWDTGDALGSPDDVVAFVCATLRDAPSNVDRVLECPAPPALPRGSGGGPGG
jgi:serine/threonine protein kinase/WD40 repeat protein